MNTLSHALAMPMLAMLVLTMLVWIYLFLQRVGYATANKLDIEDMKSPQDVAKNVKGNNLSCPVFIQLRARENALGNGGHLGAFLRAYYRK